MDSYGSFALIYDEFMNVPYDKWANYIENIWNKNGLKPKLVLDMACGTASLTGILAKKGYDMIGIDESEDMLAIARAKCDNVLFLQQDICDFELYGTVDSIISSCDSINYIIDEGELQNCFRLVNNYLNPGGIFIFDINSPYKYEKILADNTFAATDDKAAYIWENHYDSQTKINEYALTFFIKSGTQGLYAKHEELHYQRAYEIDEIMQAIAKAGLKPLGIYGELTFGQPKKDCQRIFFVAQRSLV